ncbi:PD-(D/E)XK nuclease family protein [Kaustia mangrovi]|uniref:PD-(D/E)XK nuclease family protein n=1 Tax=Kaustia mangrovi TaxID=2593653 RepID=A0A7S8C5Z2_9HYPH|nr:PD-(D/E)XK nuclease family protein [Kaustia mangrovi]QPC44028.1 PD-(D/E)XK nuclease family protein [Kaustia mangrovi]
MRRIRSSMLPGYADCARRAAAKQYRDEIQAAGYELRSLMPSIGAAVGTATHAAVEHVLRHKMETGEPGRIGDGVAAAMEALREEIAPGAEWDETTPNLQTAELQVRRLAEAYMPLVADIEPAGIEMELTAQISPKWELTGKIDLYTRIAALDDLKTGAVRRPYQAQLGSYSILLRSHGKPVTSVGTTFLPRARKTKPQPPPERQHYDRAVCEAAAFATIKEITRDVEAFAETADPFAFRANPMSLMCSARYCPAHGTEFCKLHIDQEKDNGPVD